LGNVVIDKHRSGAQVIKEDTIWILAFLITLFNVIAPVHVRYRYQLLLIALVMFFVLILSKLMRVRGRNVVNTPRLPRRIKQKTG
jgi:hypothetical protein